jgi:hypothetical protein
MKNVAVKKLDISDVVSNLAVLCAAVVVSLPLLLGDQLVVVVSKFVNEGAFMIQDLANSFLMLLG